MFIVAQDPRASNIVKKSLGKFTVKFNKNDDFLNNRIPKKYQLYEQILNEFVEPPAPNTSPLPKIFSLGLIGLLFVFLKFGVSDQAIQFSKLDNIWSLVYIINYLVVYAVIVKFWINTRLDMTLWVLLALVPSTFITIKYGLKAENCSCKMIANEKSVKSVEQED